MNDAQSTARRITVNLRPADVDRMDEIAEATSLSANEILRRALATESFMIKNRKAGVKVLLQDENGQIREVELLY